MGARKTGDKYNYEAAAFLKGNKIEYPPLAPIDFTGLSFNADPQEVFSQEFNQLISIDLLISSSTIEYIAECKHSDLPRPLSINSPEFKESILEFIGLENYRRNQFRNITYCVLIVNMPKRQVEKEILELRNDPTQLPEYIEKLSKQAKVKWPGFDRSISPRSLLAVLNELIILEIDHGSIQQAKKDKKYWEALKEILDDIPLKRRQLIPFGLLNNAQIRLTLEGESDDLLKIKENKHTIEVSTKIIDEILLFQSDLAGNIIRATASKLPWLKIAKVLSSEGIPIDITALRLTEAINDLINRRDSKIRYISIFYPRQLELYCIEVNWASQTVRSIRDTNSGKFRAKKLAQIGMLPPYASEFLIKETKRLLQGIIVDDDRIDRT